MFSLLRLTQVFHELPPSGGGPAPEIRPEPRPRERRCECEMCECTLTTSGEVLKMSDKARKYRDQSETIARLERDLAKEQSEHATTREKLRDATAPASARPTRVALGR